MRTTLLMIALSMTACTTGLVDYDGTGIAIAPGPGAWTSPTTLRVVNRTGQAVTCQVAQSDSCPNESAFLDLVDLAPKSRWQLEGVDCVIVDIACIAQDATANLHPAIRSWSWEIVPATDTATSAPDPSS